MRAAFHSTRAYINELETCSLTESYAELTSTQKTFFVVLVAAETFMLLNILSTDALYVNTTYYLTRLVFLAAEHNLITDVGPVTYYMFKPFNFLRGQIPIILPLLIIQQTYRTLIESP